MVEDAAHEADVVREKARRPPRLELGRLEEELTHSDEIKRGPRAIARRLEQDRLSEDFRIRVLAVEAMAQIGAHIFDGSLFAATEDNSPEVRSIADRALAHANPTRRAAP